MAEEITDCCKRVDPCNAVCLIDNVLVDLIAGRAVTGYRVGEESFQIRPPTIAEARALRVHFVGLCNESQGRPARRRASVCFVHGRHRCRMCSCSPCRCR